jgi:NADH:ubiquinone oxidoreductase subunit E
MGSACFSRASNATVVAVQQYIASKGLEDSVVASGTLCQNRCKEGPNIFINGECLCGIDPDTLPALLDDHFGIKGG